ncbi:MAG: hypothetical protein IJ481_00750 [Alphaproteobacteria bacterium]|nr:hypothetical protein [Alphaproteobacteria bacterium]
MILSIFIHNGSFHISNFELSVEYGNSKGRALADSLPLYLKDFLSKIDRNKISRILYPSGPGSFTTMRMVHSIVKGISIASNKVDFFGISSFLTYYYFIKKDCFISIPTMRGDFFVCGFVADNQTIEYIANESKGFATNSDYFNGNNFALDQIYIFKSKLATNKMQINSHDIVINYGFTPRYTNKKA